MKNKYLGKILSYRGRKCVVVNVDENNRPTLLMALEPLGKGINWGETMLIDKQLIKNGFGWRIPTREMIEPLRDVLKLDCVLPIDCRRFWLWTRTSLDTDETRAWDLDLNNIDFYSDEKISNAISFVALPFFELKWKN